MFPTSAPTSARGSSWPPASDGLVKIKDLEFKRTEKVEDVLNIGDMTWVKVMNVGPKGIDLRRKDALKERGEA